jgi:hypothetical protein
LENYAIGSSNASYGCISQQGNPSNVGKTSEGIRGKFQIDGTRKSPGQHSYVETTIKPYSNQISSESNLQTSNYSFDSPKKSKLPHGLTVQELKEMTRARLDEQHRNSISSSGKILVYQQPFKVQSVASERTESHFRVDRIQSLETKKAVSPRFVQDQLVLSPHTIGCGPSVSNTSSLHYLPEASVINGVDKRPALHYNRAFEAPSVDLFETESYTSINSNIQSDFNPSIGASFNDFADVPFHRAKTYPGFESNGSRNQFEIPILPNVIYNTPISQFSNSQLSPRNGRVEGQNEYHTVMEVPSELFFPIGKEDSISRASPTRTRFYSDSGTGQRDFEFNRGRTASAPSVSSFFNHTRELFSEKSLGMSHYLSRSEMHVRDNVSEIPNSIAESILDESLHGIQANNSGLSSMVEKLSLDSRAQLPRNPWDNSRFISQTLANSPSLTDDSDLGLEFDSVLSLSGIEPPPGFHVPSEARSSHFLPFSHDQENSSAYRVGTSGAYNSISTVSKSFPSQKNSVFDHC